MPATREIVAAHPDELIFVVSHKATIRLIIGYFLGIDLKGYRDRLDQRPACLNALEFKTPDNARLTLLNDVSHYHDDLMDEHSHIV